MTMHKNYITALIILFVSCAKIAAQAPAWTVNPAAFSNSINITAQIYLDGSEENSGANLLGAFAGNELRGVASPMLILGKAYYFLNVYSNVVSGETISFKVYLAASDEIYPALEQTPFVKNAQLGSYPGGFGVNISATNDFPISLLPIAGATTLAGYPIPETALDDYLVSQDNDPVSWSVSGGTNLTGTIGAGNILQVSAINPSWTGTENLLVTATETGTPNGFSASQNVSFTINPDYAAPSFEDFPVEFLQSNIPLPSGNLNDRLTFGGNCLEYAVELALPEGTAPMPVWQQPNSNSGSMSLVVQAEFGGDLVTGAANKLAGFVGGQLAGVATPQMVAGKELYFLTLANVGSGEITMKFYDATRQYLHEKETGMSFLPAGSAGSFGQPVAVDFAPILVNVSPTGEWTTTVLKDDWTGEQRGLFSATDCQHTDKQDIAEVIFLIEQCAPEMLELQPGGSLCLRADGGVSSVIWFLNNVEVGTGETFGAAVEGVYHYEGLNAIGCPILKGCPVVIEAASAIKPDNKLSNSIDSTPPVWLSQAENSKSLPPCGGIILVSTTVDPSPPTAICKTATLNLDAIGNATLVPANVDNGSHAPCGIESFSLSQTAFNCSHLGSNTVTLTAEDADGKTGECTATVTVNDAISPVIICKNISISLSATGDFDLTPAQVLQSGSDNCGTVNLLSVYPNSFTCSDLGAKQVTLIATDGHNNFSICTPTVTVEDNENPSITCPANITVINDPGQCSAVVNYTAVTHTDNCSSILSNTGGLPSGEPFPVGITTNNWKATDPSSNIATCSFTVTVNKTGDPGLLYAYTVIGFEDVKMKKSKVLSGGVGVVSAGKKATLEQVTLVTAANTFVKAPILDLKTGSQVTTYYAGKVASGILPVFQPNTAPCNNDVDIPDNSAPVTLSLACYGKIEVGKNTTVTFSGNASVKLKELKLKENSTVLFAQSTNLLIDKKLDCDKKVTISNNGHTVWLFVEDDVKIGEGSSIAINIYSEKNLQVEKGAVNTPTSMTGLFIANKVDSKEYVYWNWVASECPFLPPLTNMVGTEDNATTSDPDVDERDEHSPVGSIRDGLQWEMSGKYAVFPNPARDRVNVLLPSETGKNATFQIVNGQGVVVEQRRIDSLPMEPVTFELNRYPDGIYWLNIQVQDKRRALKFVVLDAAGYTH
ncbi:MAG: HYR domain-containing protein [Saprospiraceae bacterium]|nr:HYR domain-containing protein [Saprospiraceae bacterium]